MADFQSKIEDIKGDSKLVNELQLREQELVAQNSKLTSDINELKANQHSAVILNTQIEEMGKEVIRYQSLCQQLLNENEKLKKQNKLTNESYA